MHNRHSKHAKNERQQAAKPFSGLRRCPCGGSGGFEQRRANLEG